MHTTLLRAALPPAARRSAAPLQTARRPAALLLTALLPAARRPAAWRLTAPLPAARLPAIGLMAALAAVTLISTALAWAAPARAAEPLSEIEVRAQREKLSLLLQEMVKLEDHFYERYNELNKEPRFNMVCEKDAKTGSHLKSRNCLPVFVTEAQHTFAESTVWAMQSSFQGDASDLAGGGLPAAASGEILRKWPEFENNMLEVMRENPELVKLANEHEILKMRYELARRVKFVKGKERVSR